VGFKLVDDVYLSISDLIVRIGVFGFELYFKFFIDVVVCVVDVVVMMGCGDVCLFYLGKCYLDWDVVDLVDVILE